VTARIAVIAGDGIGPEVIDAAIPVLEAAVEATGVEPLTFDRLPWSSRYYLETGRMMPTDALEQLAEYDAIYLGAIGSPEVPDHVTIWGVIMPIRQAFDQYVNLRPVKLLPGVQSPLRDRRPEEVDIVCVRENSEGEYADIGGRVHERHDSELAVQASVFTRRGVERVVEYACRLAESRPRRRLASATKSNAWAYGMTLWDEVCAEVVARHPELEFSRYHVDALAARLVTAPDSLDVIVCSNLFGDILSDLGGAIVGGLGVAGSANIDPSRRHPSMFEPVHGSAPDIAGTGSANPFGAVWAGSMMLAHLGLEQEAGLVVQGLEHAAASPETRTVDLGGSATTDEAAAAVLGHIRSADLVRTD
jgi:tartrate dehydrogenase/decarboxylase / D-malate dehydrogenase